jgi:regulator of sirC expression with transglutaminase-like and TPR domain
MPTGRTAVSILEGVGALRDREIDLAETALALAALDRPQTDWERYRVHLAELGREVAALGPVAAERADALRDVLVGHYGYRGDSESYDDLDNANLIRVIDRRRGLPVALSILWLHAARMQGWAAEGLNFPSHFLIRLDSGHGHVVLDPFDGGAVRTPEELRALRQRLGGDAQSAAEHYAPVGNRAILLRLQNNIRLRLVQAGRREEALAVAERMVVIAPHQAALWQECAGLHRELGNLRTAIACLERAMTLAGGEATRQGVAAAAELQALRGKLN